MNSLKVCFVGIGSIARRHIGNLTDVCWERSIELTIDVLRMIGRNDVGDIDSKIKHFYYDEKLMPNDYDVIFLTNPTEFHLDMLKKLHDKSRNFFIEKPLTSYKKLEDTFKIPYRENSIYYVACPLRYTDVVQYLKENINISDVISVRCISSSYLPDWRPGTDYRKTYSADKELGGGVSIDLIHEWDYIRFLFGKPVKVFYTYGQKSSLEINCEDYAVYVADYADKIVELHLDYFGRKTLREIMIFTNEDTIVGDFINSKVSYLKNGTEICFGEQRNDFQKKELRHFLDILDGKTECDNNVSDAYETLLLTQGEIR